MSGDEAVASAIRQARENMILIAELIEADARTIRKCAETMPPETLLAVGFLVNDARMDIKAAVDVMVEMAAHKCEAAANENGDTE